MWTRRSSAAFRPIKFCHQLRDSYLRRYLEVRQYHLQALTSPLQNHEISTQPHSTGGYTQQQSSESFSTPQSSSACSDKSLTDQVSKDPYGPLECQTNAQIINTNSQLLKLRHFCSYNHVGVLPGTIRRFRSLSNLNSKSEIIPETTIIPVKDGNNHSSGNVGATDSWHTKLSVILASDTAPRRETRIVVERTASLARLTAQSAEQYRRSKDASIPQGGTPTPFTVCQAIRNQGDVDQAWKYFTWAGQQDGCAHNGETYNAMVQALCGAKRIGAVFDLLETMREDGISMTHRTCVQIMKSLVSERRYEKALLLFQNVANYDCKPNVVVYNSYLDVLVKAGYFDLLEATYAKMSQGGLVPDIYTYNILINGFGKADKVDKARQVFNEMKQRTCTPTVVTYNTLLHALGKAGKTDEVLELFCEMSEKDVGPSAFTYSSLLFFFGKDSRKDLKTDTTRHSSRQRGEDSSRPVISTYQNLVDTLCKRQDCDAALRMLREMESSGHITSLATYNLLAVFLGDAGKVDATLELFKDMKAKGCVPDAFTYKTVIEAACRARKADEALLLHKEMMAKGHTVSVATCNMLLDVAAKAGQVDTAFELFSQMQQSCKPDMYSYNILIFSLCTLRNNTDPLTCLNKAGFTSKIITSGVVGALEVYRRMKGSSSPDVITYRTLIHALCRAGRVNECEAILAEMEENGFDPGVLVYNKVLNTLGSAGKVEKAWKLFLQMQSNDVADLITYTTLIKVLARTGRFGKATRLLEEMEGKGFEPNIVTYTTLVDGLAKSRRFVEVDRLFKQMVKKGCSPGKYAYNSLVDAYCKAGQVAQAYRIFEESIDKGFIPDTYIYNSLIDGYFRSGNANDALDIYNVMKGMGCKANGVTYNILLTGLCKAGRKDDIIQILEEISHRGTFSTGVSASSLDRALQMTGSRIGKAAVVM